MKTQGSALRCLKLVPGLVLAVWCAGSLAQQPSTPPAGNPPAGAPPARTPPASAPPASTPQPGAQPATPPAQDKEGEKPQAASDKAEDEFIPTEELNPDAAVTFPVDI
jgi:hypothetical protein